MKFSHQLLLFIALLLLPLAYGADPIYQRCEQNITGNKALQDKIDIAIYNLIASTPIRGYAISTSGGIYGLARCRGDISSQDCSDCVVAAAKQLRTSCPFAIAARAWRDFCSFRYANSNFIGIMDASDAKGWGSAKRATNPAAFNSKAWRLMNEVKVAAASAGNKFGMGKRSFSGGDGVTIYGMAYCTPDLSGFSCMECLEKLSGMMRAQCADRVGCLFMCSSCGMRYEVYWFFRSNNAPGASPSTPAIA